MDIERVRHYLIGHPFPTSMEIHERLDKVRALAIFASDPISSNAYATEAIMTVLVIMGGAGLRMTLPLGLGVAGLVLLVVFSYIQTIYHYPDGGGAYTVARDNLGTTPSLLAAGALMTDYVLTVAVSVAAGVRAVTSAFPEMHPHRVLLALAAIGFITWINLRGVRESGTVFSLPTYAFVAGGLAVVGLGLLRLVGAFGMPPLQPSAVHVAAQVDLTGFAYIWLLLRAFAGGCTALTGIEAISNGVQAFKPPEAPNAVKTMIGMAVMAMSLFIGITYLSTHLALVPTDQESILSQLTRMVSGRGVLYFWVQAFTMLILFLAANTGYQGFPLLGSYLARDGFLPRWMRNRGDRLVFSYGIAVLSLLASVLVITFQANEIAMLPLYAIGVMLSFSLSQSGMFRLMGRIAHLKPGESLHTLVTEIHYESGVRWKRLVNALGAAVTFIVFVVLVTTKFLEGAWIVVVTIPLLVGVFLEVNRHYDRVASALRTRDMTDHDLTDVADVVLVPIGDVHRGVLRALKYARRLSDDVRAICITTSPEMRRRVEDRWSRFPELTEDVHLICIDYDYRDIMTPLVDYILRVNHEEFPEQLVTVVIPEFVAETLWERTLHNQTANSLRRALHQHHDLVVIDVPYHIMSTKEWRAGQSRTGQ
jgi:amino acid transporter